MTIHARALLAFSDALNERWFPGLRQVDPGLLDHNFEFSFRSPLGILTHIGNVEHQWMNVVEGKPADWRHPPHSTKEFHELEPVLAFLEATRARTHDLVDDLDEAGLQRACPVEPGVFAKDAFTVEELLWIVFTHEQWHRGELIAALWSRDVQPPDLDWHRYATPLTLPSDPR